jgi:putative transposase
MMPPEVRRELVERQSPEMSVVRQCKLLSIHRSGLYYTPSPESDENLGIMRWLDEQYLSTPFYGVERFLPLLTLLGYRINRKRLRRLMRMVGWQTLYPSTRTTIPGKDGHKYPYLLKGLKIDRPNQVWAIDITYIPMSKGFMYLFAIIDVYSRYVVGWSLSNTMSAEWCVDCIEEAISVHGTPEIINSDQGSQFTSDIYTDCLKRHEIRISMDGRGRAIDNIFIERLWRSVKYEHIYLHAYDDGNSLWKGLNGYFRFYNHDRLHQSLGYRAPIEVFQCGTGRLKTA